MVKTYYMLTKPGIILGNVITTAGGFALASKGHFDVGLFLLTMLGLSFVIASAGVFNNYIDRAMDAKMERTKNRAFPLGLVSVPTALIYGTILGILGISLLYLFTNPLTVLVTFTGFFVYLVLYAFLKYRSFYGTIVGSIAGGVPPLVGYCAVSNRLDEGALLIFMILVLWQMPHFFAIAIYRYDDYAAVKIPVLPVEKGVYVTKWHMVFYIVAFFFKTLLLTFIGFKGYMLAMVAVFMGLTWLGLCIQGFNIESSQDQKWGKLMFRYSLAVIMGIFLIIPFDLKTETGARHMDLYGHAWTGMDLHGHSRNP